MVSKTLTWYPFFKPWRPYNISGERVVFPVGDYSVPTNFRELVEHVHRIPHHKFVLTNEDPELFYGLPLNSIPVLHVSSRDELKKKEAIFRENTEGHPYRGLSIFCGKESISTAYKWDIVIVKGYSFIHMDNTIKRLRSQGNPVYVDSFKRMIQTENIPDRFRIRQLEGILN